MLTRKTVWLLIGGVVFVLILFLTVPWKKSVDHPKPSQPSLRGEMISPAMEDLPILREVPGRTVAVNTVVLSSRVTGFVKEVLVDEGSPVTAGQVVLTLDDRDLQARLRQAAAERERAAARLQRIKTLYAEGAAAKDHLEEAERAYQVADAEKTAVQAEWTYTRITSPLHGVVTRKSIESGELATPGRPLLQMEDPLRLRFEAMVGEQEVGGLKKGQKVTLWLDRFEGREFSVAVTEIIPASDPVTHSVLVQADIPFHPGLQSGLFGRMIFSTDPVKRLLLPRSAVLEREGLVRIYVTEEQGTLQSRFVTLGKAYGDRVEILTGLNPGERVLRDAASGIQGRLVIHP